MSNGYAETLLMNTLPESTRRDIANMNADAEIDGKEVARKILQKEGDDADKLLARFPDAVNQPAHYTSHPSGIECIQVTEHMSFNIGNAIKYLWRCDLKKDAIEDLKKAAWYINREISKREGKQA